MGVDEGGRKGSAGQRRGRSRGDRGRERSVGEGMAEYGWAG